MSKYVLGHYLKGEGTRLALMAELLDPMHRRHIETQIGGLRLLRLPRCTLVCLRRNRIPARRPGGCDFASIE